MNDDATASDSWSVEIIQLLDVGCLSVSEEDFSFVSCPSFVICIVCVLLELLNIHEELKSVETNSFGIFFSHVFTPN